ncbi:hypothetical protein B0H14DRAFT_3467369 [Mycena olivaceomarginata]|nr:hypothetical protein B0H14DRAFT_3467369 [Mycena olivaceomarginata]
MAMPPRFLKIKCDGMKPICGPCRKSPKDDECEYSDGPARSRTKALEDTVQRLEARLHELEHPEDTTPSVTLYDPYAPPPPPPQLTISPLFPGSSSSSLPSTPFHQLPRVLSPMNSSPPASQGYSPSSTAASSPPFGAHASLLGISGLASPESTPSILESDQNICERLLQTFHQHASEFGFFLHWTRFIQSSRQRVRPDGTVHNNSSALLNTLYMWGAHLSADRERELHFKQKALQSVAAELTPHSFLHTIQAEVLLSYYFFRTGHFLEARAHTATAVALALGGGLHQIRSLNPDAPVMEITEDNDQAEEIHLRASADAVEEGERINGFWAVFMLQKNLSVALEPPARVCGVFEAGGMQIDTPWPLEMSDYKQGLLTPDIHGDWTVRNFLQQGGTPNYYERSSITAMNVKACILLHRAVYMHGQYNPNVPEREAQGWWTAFGAVDQLINALRSELPDLAQLQGRSAARTILLTHSLLNAATIKLHSIFYTDPTSRQNCLAAARDMFRFGGMNMQGLGYLNPMMGTLWLTACNVFVDELRRIRAESVHGTWPLQLASAQEREKEMLASLHDGLDALSAFARESLLMRHQLTKVQEALAVGGPT